MWDEGQLDALARISESDRQAAAVTARRALDRRHAGILDAGEDDSDWEYAALLGLFLLRGRAVAPAIVREQLDRALAVNEAAARNLSQNSRVSARPWGVAMVDVVKTGALISGAFAAGGWLLLDTALGDIEAHIRSELNYLDKFADEVAAGRIPRDGRFVRRAMLYGSAGWGLYQALRGRRARALAYHEERNVLDPGAEHCAGCQDETAQGWQPIGTLSQPGDRQCRSNCRCHLEYRNRTGEVTE